MSLSAPSMHPNGQTEERPECKARLKDKIIILRGREMKTGKWIELWIKKKYTIKIVYNPYLKPIKK